MKAIGDAKVLRIWLHKTDGEEGGGGGEGEGEGVWDDARVTFGGIEEGDFLSNHFLFQEIPIELWVAGDLKWIAAAYGKENSSGHWCPWCLQSPKEWSGAQREDGDHNNYTAGTENASSRYWSLELLQEFAEGVENGTLKSSSQRRGVVSRPVIDYVGPDKIAFPILHATLGFGNDWLKSFIKEMQAISEAYTEEYLAAEEAMAVAAVALENSVRRLREYKAQTREFVMESRKALRRRGANALADVQKQALTADLDRINSEISRLQEEVDSCKEAKEATKETFNQEASKDENSKAYGQPIRKGIEQILKRHGIDKGAAFGGDLQGNACRKLMEKAATIVDEVKEYMKLPETVATRAFGTEKDIQDRCHLYANLLTAFDGCISGLRTKRFHVTDVVVEQTDRYVKKVMELTRYLGFNITPKLHCLECHAVYFLRKHSGFADLAEDAGERAHQSESKMDLRWAAQRSHDRRELSKAANEAKQSDPRVQQKVKEMHENTRAAGAEKRKAAVEENREERKKIKLSRREQVLEAEVLDGRAEKFSEMRVARFRAASELEDAGDKERAT